MSFAKPLTEDLNNEKIDFEACPFLAHSEKIVKKSEEFYTTHLGSPIMEFVIGLKKYDKNNIPNSVSIEHPTEYVIVEISENHLNKFCKSLGVKNFYIGLYIEIHSDSSVSFSPPAWHDEKKLIDYISGLGYTIRKKV